MRENTGFLLGLGVLLIMGGSGFGACSSRKLPKPSAVDRGVVQRAIARAARDSAEFVRCGFVFRGTMMLGMSQDAGSITITDAFELVKEHDSLTIQTRPESHTVTGDTTLLKDMYTFRTSQGGARGATQGQLAGLSFGADFLRILRVLAADTTSASYSIGDSVVRMNADTGQGRRILKLRFITPDREGVFWIDRDSLMLMRSEVSHDNNYVVGSYEYRIATDYVPVGVRSKDSSVLSVCLPVAANSTFNYRRLFTRGTGIMSVKVNTDNNSDGSDSSSTR